MKDYYLIFNNTPRGPFSLQDLQMQTILPDTQLWKEGWPDWTPSSIAAQSYPELKRIIGEARLADQEDASFSVADNLYQRIGDLIDRKIMRNQHRLDSHVFYRLLHRWRERYLQLAPSKQTSFRLILSSLTLLMAFWLAFSSFSWGWSAMTLWIAFVALGEIPAISHIIDKLAKAIIHNVLMFLPRFLRRLAARYFKTITVLGIACALSNIIAPIYFLYHLVILMVATRTTKPSSPNSSS